MIWEDKMVTARGDWTKVRVLKTRPPSPSPRPISFGQTALVIGPGTKRYERKTDDVWNRSLPFFRLHAPPLDTWSVYTASPLRDSIGRRHVHGWGALIPAPPPSPACLPASLCLVLEKSFRTDFIQSLSFWTLIIYCERRLTMWEL